MYEFITTRYKEKTPQSKILWNQAKNIYLDQGASRGVFKYGPYPIYLTHCKGSRIVDVDGNEYIDYCFNFTSLILGHAHPSITDAVMESIKKGPPAGGPVETEIHLAEEIAERIPCGEITRFTPSGTEAGMNIVRLARAFTKKKKIAKFEGCYHGTYDSLFTSFQPKKGLSGNPTSPTSIPDSEGILPEVVENTIIIPYNNISAVEKIIRQNKDHLAAVIVEPVMPRSGAGGGLVLPKIEFLKTLREVTEQYGILLIYDEVVTGFRLSRGGAQGYYQVIPDLSMLGKVIGGGYPIGAVTGGHEIMRLVSGSSHSKDGKAKVPISGTFSAHPISVTAGLATLKELTPNIYERMEKSTSDLTKSLRKILNDLGIKAVVENIGSLFNISFTDREVIDYRSSLTANQQLFQYFTLDLFSKGVYWAPNHFSNLSAVTTSTDIKDSIKAFEKTLEILKPLIKNLTPNLLI